MTLSCLSDKGKHLFDSWLADPTAIPVSYTYDGTRYHGFPAAALSSRCDSEENGVRKTTLTFSLADTLQAVVTLVFCPEYGETEYECVFENNGSSISAVLEDVHTAEVSFAGDTPRLIGILGDLQNQYHPYDRDLTAEDVSFASVSGRATHVYFPYFNLACGDGGYLLAIGWAGTWQADFAYRAGKTDVTLQATRGMKTVLLPGESVSAALTVILPYEGHDMQEAMNLWRRWFLDYNMPRADASGTPITPFTTSWFAIDTGLPNSDGSISERCDTWQKTVDKLEKENIRLDFHWFDAGWYCAPDGSTVPADWWGTIGTWDP
ncbi:MAG: hypothetical protein IJ302_05450, partial [Clostridia bacterium]|nr:hypothetical protein [Clostridia bacterium]